LLHPISLAEKRQTRELKGYALAKTMVHGLLVLMT
jgi:hypothetical protein